MAFNTLKIVSIVTLLPETRIRRSYEGSIDKYSNLFNDGANIIIGTG